MTGRPARIAMATAATCARIEAFGPPSEVLGTAPLRLPDPAPDEVLVEMRWAPINPADFNLLEGTYAVLPELPATPGIEGSGVAAAVGSRVTRVRPGDRVVAYTTGNWCSHRLFPESDLFVVPPRCDLRQAAMLKVNPTTAWLLLHEFVELGPGDAILQNAANSNVGRCVIQLARRAGWRTINLLRRPELFAELEELGADEVLLDDDGVRAALKERWRHARPRLGLNAVGGDSAVRVAAGLATSGRLVTYGAMSKEAVGLPNAFLIFRDVRARGFWLKRWLLETPLESRDALLATLARLISEGELGQPVDSVFPLSRVTEAVARAQAPDRVGKVLLDLQG